MRFASMLLVCAGLVAAATSAQAELTSGPQPGESVGAFIVTKVGGNAEDGVADGKALCYRCKMGARPVVMVFARSGDASLAKLVKKIEAEVAEHEDEKLTSFVNMIGADVDSLKSAAAKFVKSNGVERVAFVVPDEASNGPEDFKISPDADVTVVCYKNGTVVANHAFAKGELTDEKIGAVADAACSLVE